MSEKPTPKERPAAPPSGPCPPPHEVPPRLLLATPEDRERAERLERPAENRTDAEWEAAFRPFRLTPERPAEREHARATAQDAALTVRRHAQESRPPPAAATPADAGTPPPVGAAGPEPARLEGSPGDRPEGRSEAPAANDPPALSETGAPESEPESFGEFADVPELSPDWSVAEAGEVIARLARPATEEAILTRLGSYYRFEATCSMNRQVWDGRLFICLAREVALGVLADLAENSPDERVLELAANRIARYEDRLDEQLERHRRAASQRYPISPHASGVIPGKDLDRKARRWLRLARRAPTPLRFFSRLYQEEPAVIIQLSPVGTSEQVGTVRGKAIAQLLWLALHAREPRDRLRRASDLYRTLLARRDWRRDLRRARLNLMRDRREDPPPPELEEAPATMDALDAGSGRALAPDRA